MLFARSNTDTSWTASLLTSSGIVIRVAVVLHIEYVIYMSVLLSSYKVSDALWQVLPFFTSQSLLLWLRSFDSIWIICATYRLYNVIPFHAYVTNLPWEYWF